MSANDIKNEEKQLASRFINSTGRHIFLTGRAGTGKTTFLKNILSYTHKKAVVAAPTGIAAINAGGVTLHSLFQLPFGSFLPSERGLAGKEIQTEIHTPQSLIRGRRYFDAKRKLLREIELLIIDEVSMLRADLLDAIDVILQHVRRKRNVPFGGVQILFIGDLLQLPPVVKHEAWNVLQNFYPGLYFFQARALKQNPPVYIELDHIYRQSDPEFIRLLNKIRDNKLDSEGLSLLNKRVQPDFDPLDSQGYVYLTTHNHKADRVNNKAMQKIKNPVFTYEALVEKDFDEKTYPVEYKLQLKKDAQVMFVKNDHTGDQRYFNGKIGVIDQLGEEGIRVAFDDGTPSTWVERYTWENKKYSVNQENNEIEEKLQGTFSQYPLKLAWAITVHKSQGLTFDKAVIDVSSAFAPGQIYVAMSRLTSLDGLVLSRPLPEKPPGQDPELQRFHSDKAPPANLKEVLKEESITYLRQELMRMFHFGDLSDMLRWHLQSYNKAEKRSAKQGFKAWAQDLYSGFEKEKIIADRFLLELRKKIAAKRMTDLETVKSRVQKAGSYFKPKLQAFSRQIIDHIAEVEKQKGTKAYARELRDLETAFFDRMRQIHKAAALIHAMIENKEPTHELTSDPDLQKERDTMLDEGKVKVYQKTKTLEGRGKNQNKPGKKEKKTTSAEVSYALFKEGKSVEEIAQIRQLAESTIMSHMAENIEKDLLNVDDFLDQKKREQILAASDAIKSSKLTDIIRVLGDEFTFSDIRLALAFKKSQNH